MLSKNGIDNFLKSGWAVAILCLLWLIPGLFGHDPWKADEPYSFGIVNHIITTGDWVVPTVAGVPFMEKPPLFYLTASVFARLFYPLLPLHDGARLTCAFFMIITFIFTALSSRELYGRGSGRIALLILMGTVGLVNHAHKLMTDVALLTGFAVAIYGLILSRRKELAGGFFIGTGVGIGFMAKGLLAPGLLGIIAVVLPLWCGEWRNRKYLFTLAVALLAALPWFIIWPLTLYQKAPHLFKEWFWVQNFGRFFGYAHQGPPNEPGYYLFHIPYFAWPAFPLILLLVLDQVRSKKVYFFKTMPFAAFTVMLLVMSVASDARALYALPMLLPLSLLAVPAVTLLTRELVAVSNYIITALFLLVFLVIWLGWIILQTGYPGAVFAKLIKESPAYVPSVNPGLFSAALFVTVLFIFVLRYQRLDGKGLVFRWTAGLTVVWTLMMTLWLPFVDASRSYRSLVLDLKRAVPLSSDRIAGKSLGESERAMLEYFGGIRTVTLEDDRSKTCNLLLVATSRAAKNNNIGSEWRQIWEGARPGHKSELFVLYQSSRVALSQL